MPDLQRDGVRIRYDVFRPDDDAPLLLTHGFGGSGQDWAQNAEVLAAKRPVITWDMRGHGHSDSPADQAEYTQEACVADMAAILDACGVDRAIVGGLSLGGYLSLAFWLDHPERVIAMVLCDTGPGFRSATARQRWNDQSLATAGRLERDGPRHHGMARAARGMLTQQDGRVIETLPAVDVPVLVIVGADDRPFLGAAEYLAAKIPGAEHVIIPAAGHTCNRDQPEPFNRHVLEFLSRLPPGG